MKSCVRRTWFLLALGALAVPLAAAAVAYGCTAAAVITASPGAAAAGGTVTVTGKYFDDTHSDSPGSAGPVQIRLGSVDGPVLGTADASGTDRAFTVRVRIPSTVAAGDTLLVGTQFEADGRPVYGTPARQAFKVLPTPAAPTAPLGPLAQFLAPVRRVLTMATARRLARARVKRSKPNAKRIRARCGRRSATTAVCRVRYEVGSKTRTKRLVVRLASSS